MSATRPPTFVTTIEIYAKTNITPLTININLWERKDRLVFTNVSLILFSKSAKCQESSILSNLLSFIKNLDLTYICTTDQITKDTKIASNNSRYLIPQVAFSLAVFSASIKNDDAENKTLPNKLNNCTLFNLRGKRRRTK